MGLLDLRTIKRKKEKRVRKSGFEDAFFVLIVLFAISIFILILAKAWGDIRTPLEEGLSDSTPDNTAINFTTTFDGITSTINLFDTLIPLLIIGLISFVLIGAGMYMQHPIMIVVGIIILGVAILIAGIFSNVYHQISESENFASTVDDFGISEIFMEHLPAVIIIMFVGITLMVIWLKTAKTGGGGL